MVTARKVVIVAPPGDVHALVVAARIESRGCEVVVWDSARLPLADKLSVYLSSSGRQSVILESTACGTIDFADVRSVWWRRPSAPTIPSSVVGDYMRDYCRSETDQLFRGALTGLSVPIYNDPDAEQKASRKVYQLRVAAEVGLVIPKTLVTCSPQRALEFCETSTTVPILKPFRTPIGSLCSTREYGDSLSAKLTLLNNAPSIFQEKIAPHRDVRVAVIGKKICAGISSSQLLDWRVDSELTWTAHELPVRIQRLISKLLGRLGLTFGHIDFRLTPQGEYVFLEVNPSGQFLFMEIDDNNIGVTSALADYLIKSDTPRSSSRSLASSF